MKTEKAIFFSAVATFILLVIASPVAASDPVMGVSLQQEMQDSSGTIEVLVNLEDVSGATTPEQLKRGAERSQRDFLEYVESTDEVRVLKTFWITNAVLIEVDADYDLEKLGEAWDVRSLRTNTDVEVMGASTTEFGSTPERTVSASTTQAALSTTSNSLPYGVKQINAPDVWSNYGTKGDGVKVAILDSGVNVDHPDIDLYTTNSSDPTYPGGWAEFDSDGNRVNSEPYDSDGHGTHISGTLAGDKTGVAPGVDLMHGLIVNGRSGKLSQALSGMEWAVDNNADVISFSIGGDSEDAWIDAVKNANDAGTVVISSIGNDGSGTSTSPGNVYNSISVGAVDSNLDVAHFSSGGVIDTQNEWGNSALAGWPDEYVVPDVVGAGVNINSTSVDGGYTTKSGTSMSSPLVAGATALSLSASGNAGTKEMRRALSLTAYGSGSEGTGTRYGHGAVDALAATEFLLDDAKVSGTVVDTSGSTVSDAELRVEGAYVSTSGGDYEVGLSEGNWDIKATAPGYEDTSKTVSLSKDQTANSNIVLEKTQPPSFQVTGLEGPSKAEAGEELSVNATVENTGDETGTQDVTLRLAQEGKSLDGSTVVDTRYEVNLQGGGSATVEYTVDAPDDTGNFDYGVFTENDSETDTVTVEDTQGFFEVSSLKGPTNAETGDKIAVRATVKNTGNKTGTQDVTVRLAKEGKSLDKDTVFGTRNITLDAQDSRTVDFTVNLAGIEGSYEYGVFSQDDSTTRPITVYNPQPPFFDVTGLDGPSDTETGEEVNVTATVENTGDKTGTQDVTLRLAQEGKSLDKDTVVGTKKDIKLSSGDTQTVGFSFDAPDGEGNYDYGVFSQDDSDRGTIMVKPSPPFFAVTNLTAPDDTEINGTMTVSANVTNTGDKEDEQELTYRRAGNSSVLSSDSSVVALTNITVGADNLTAVEFDVGSPEDAGDYEHGIFTHNSSATRNVTVLSTKEAKLRGYRSVQGTVELAGLQDAIQDFIKNDISLALLQDVINEFIAS